MSAPTLRSSEPDDGLKDRVRLGHLLVGVGFFGILIWLGLADLSGAVVAPGQVVVESDLKKVQHLSGGVVESIKVRNGDRVKAGDLLVKLDETVARATLSQVASQLAQLTGRGARLAAERDNRATLDLPAGFEAIHPDARLIAEGEARLLRESREERRQTVAQLSERLGQIGKEIQGARAQLEAKKRENGFIQTELKGVKMLFEKNLTPITRLSSLQREAARLEGESGALTAGIARNEGQIAETKLQILNIEQKTRTDAIKELREVEGTIAQLNERRIAAQDTLNRIEIRAPSPGFVHEMTLHTVGGVISPGEVIMQVVSDGDRLFVEVRLSTGDIDQVKLGQKAMMRFSAFNQRTTPEVSGHVVRLAPDASRDAQTGASYYTARLVLEQGEAKKLAGLTVIPGMPVEVFLETGMRSALSYLMKPLSDSFHRAFKER